MKPSGKVERPGASPSKKASTKTFLTLFTVSKKMKPLRNQGTYDAGLHGVMGIAQEPRRLHQLSMALLGPD